MPLLARFRCSDPLGPGWSPETGRGDGARTKVRFRSSDRVVHTEHVSAVISSEIGAPSATMLRRTGDLDGHRLGTFDRRSLHRGHVGRTRPRVPGRDPHPRPDRSHGDRLADAAAGPANPVRVANGQRTAGKPARTGPTPATPPSPYGDRSPPTCTTASCRISVASRSTSPHSDATNRSIRPPSLRPPNRSE